MDNSNRSTIFYYGNLGFLAGNCYNARTYANLEPKDASISTITGNISVLGDYIFYNKKDEHNNIKSYMYDTTRNEEFLIADNSNMRLVYASDKEVITCQKLSDSDCIVRLFIPHKLEISHLEVPDLVGLTAKEIKFNGQIESDELDDGPHPVTEKRIDFKNCTVGVFNDKLLMLSEQCENGISVETKDRKYVLKSNGLGNPKETATYVDNQNIIIKNINANSNYESSSSYADELGYIDKKTNKYTKVYSGSIYSILGIDSNHNVYFIDLRSEGMMHFDELVYVFNENDMTVECLYENLGRGEFTPETIFQDNTIEVEK